MPVRHCARRRSSSARSRSGGACPGVVNHVFTHFPLELTVYRARCAAGTIAPAGTRWIPLAELDGEALPSLMRKVVAHAAGDGAHPRAREHRRD